MNKLTAILVAVLILASVGYADNLGKAEGFMQAGLYAKAIVLLDREVHINPENAEAHYELGSCYVYQERYGDADERFARAIRLDGDYRSKIGGVYKKAGLSLADRGQVDDAMTLLGKALAYQPDLKKGLVTELMAKGKTELQRRRFDSARARFAVAAEFDQSAENEACGMYARLGDAADDKDCLSYYLLAPSYCGANEKIGNRVLALADRYARKPDRENIADEYKRAAKKYLGEAVVDRRLPEVIVLTPEGCYEKRIDRKCDKGTYRFVIAKGEKTPCWLQTPSSRNVTLEHVSTNSAYEIHYRDHSSPVKIWNDEQITGGKHADEIFIATEDTLVIVNVKENAK